MQIISAVLLLLGSIAFSEAADLCASQPKSYTNVSQSSVKACASLISKAGLKLTTCSTPKSKIVKTFTVQSSVTRTVTVTQTISTTAISNVQRTIYSTVTSTAISYHTDPDEHEHRANDYRDP
ncbi:hypothetical protein N0V91_010718 [Didymella pomorum]|uniref:Uncharacterized protein n=1 Tax=Didymella pomorum TaxID=749634 RepID=A0A9W8YYP5_9PLEO|nr:hypothetical protein N0V91_010718 [Didymella pomorum]